MCGRYAATKDPATIAREFDASDERAGEAAAGASPDYNVAPAKQVLTVVQRHPRDEDGSVLADEPALRQLRSMQWGLVPFWAKDPSIGNRMINTRAETAASKPAFRKALARRRCLLPADGWFEWRRGAAQAGRGRKQPYFMTPSDGSMLAFAGVWETWRDPEEPHDAAPKVTCSILTTDAVGPLADIHHRMPLVMGQHDWQRWLDPDLENVSELMSPPSMELVGTFEIRPVSERVNSVRNNGAELIERVEGESSAQAGAQTLFDAGKADAP